jgi:hypothetical protein
LTEWEAYERATGPLDVGERLDQLFGMLQATIANVNRSKKTRPYKAEQFVPEWGSGSRSSAPMSGEDMLRAVKRINRGMGGSGG